MKIKLIVVLLLILPFSAHSKVLDEVQINFDKTDIRLFIKYISEITGRNFIIDQNVKGVVSIVSPKKISIESAYHVFESVLSVNGFTTVQAGNIIKIMPSIKATSDGMAVISNTKLESLSDSIITQLIPLTYITPEEMKTILSPLISQTSLIIAHNSSGMLIVTDTKTNIIKLQKIINSLDTDHSNKQMEVIFLKHESALKVSEILQSVYSQDQSVIITAHNRINAIVITATKKNISSIQELIKTIDIESDQDEHTVQLISLAHAKAEDIAKALTDLYSSNPKIVKIIPESNSNSLLITTSKNELINLKRIISQLDTPRQMVYLEALILEVNTKEDFNVGVKWMASGTYDNDTGLLLGGFGSGTGFSMNGSISETEGVKSINPGFSLGVLQQGIQIAGMTFPNLAAVMNFYKRDNNINIISSPQILTTDNKLAVISVGQTIPYLTRSDESNSGNGYQNYEYKDVATSLSILPQINQGDSLILEIATEVSKLDLSSSVEGLPVTFKRTTNTTVIVQNNQTIVIGGIIGNDSSKTDYKVPILGDIPLLGWLFKSSSTNHLKTNMYIFITPHIIQDAQTLAKISKDKQSQIEEVLPESAEQFQQATVSELNHLYDLGFLNLQNGNYQIAKQSYIQILNLDNNSIIARINLAAINEKQGQIQLSIEYFNQALERLSKTHDYDLITLCNTNLNRLSTMKF